MTQTKLKGMPPVRMRSLPFLGIWLLTHFVGWAATFGLYFFINETPALLSSLRGLFSFLPGDVTDVIAYAIFGLTPGFIIALGQLLLLRYAYRMNLGGWMAASIIGWTIGGIAMFTFPYAANSSSATVPLAVMMMPVALAQWLVLRHSVRQAWLWMIAIVVSGLVWGSALNSMIDLNITFNALTVAGVAGLAGLVQGAVTGASLMWLLATNQRRARNLKNEALIDQLQTTANNLREEQAAAPNLPVYTDERVQWRQS